MADRVFDILLVEDEQDHAELIQRAFESSEHSYRLRVVGTLDAARSVLATSPPCLVIADLLLPDGRGVELIPSESETAAFPVIVLTSHGNENVAVEAIKAGALDYVVKSRETLANMPHIAKRALREWEHICDQLQAKQAMRESELRFRSVVETAGNVIVILDLDGLITEWNPAAEQLYGWSREEVHSKNYFEMFLPKEIQGEVEKDVQKVLSGTPTQGFENNVRTRDGRERTLLWNVSRLLDSENCPCGIIAIGQDITERKLAKEALEAREKLYHDAIAGADAVAYQLNFKTKSYTHMDARIQGLIGYSLSEVSPDIWRRIANRTILRGESEHLSCDEASRLFRSGKLKTWHADYQLTDKQDETRWLSDSSVLLRDEQGNVSGCLGILQDITERRQAEEALRNSEERYRNLLENHVDGVAVIVDGKFHYVNERCCEIGGYTRQELLELPFLEFVAAEDRPYAIKRMTAIMNGEPSTLNVYSYIRKDGTTVPVEVAGQLITFDGKSALLTVFRDVTQRKRLEEDARQHREELAHVLRVSTMGEMATGLAHELNQPLTAIGIFAAACRTTLCSNPTMKDSEKLISILEKIEAQSQRAGRIIDRIRSLVKKREQDRSSFPVNNPIRNVVSLVEQEARMNSVVMNLQLDDTLEEVIGDAIQIEQVILNLVRNGIEAIAGSNNGVPCEMTLRTSQLRTGEIEVSISDTGPGIPEEMRGRIFEAFVSTKQNGLGMGLAISRTIVESHGGSLSFTPNSERGSTFQFTLPTFLEGAS